MDESTDPAAPATTTLLLCVRGSDADTPQRRQALERMCAAGRHEVIAAGWGPPEAAEELLRDIATRHPQMRVLLHSRPVSATEALCAGVAVARSPWILLPDAEETMLAPPANPPGPDVDCVPFGAGSVLFSREAFARLPRVPGMIRWLPELFARSGMRVVPACPTPPASWTRRARIAVLCTMAGIAAPAAFRA